MNKKLLVVAVAALALGIGGTVAYFHFYSLYVAHTAPPIPPATSVPVQQVAPIQQTAPASPNPGVIPPANADNGVPVAGGTLTDNQLVLGNISYGASIDAVRQTYGEPYEIENGHDHEFNGPVRVYKYKDAFALYVVNGLVQRIKVDDLNGLATHSGIKAGSSADDVISVYGQPALMLGDHYIYKTAANPSLGLEFELKHGFVEEIICGVLDKH